MLTVSLAAIADAANVSREGKLNITGIFDSISASAFPAYHPWMALVFVIEGDRGDAQAEHKLKVDLIDDDGNPVIQPLEGNIRFACDGPGGRINAPQILHLAHLKFDKPGTYEFKIIVNGEVRASVPIYLREAEQQQQQRCAGA